MSYAHGSLSLVPHDSQVISGERPRAEPPNNANQGMQPYSLLHMQPPPTPTMTGVNCVLLGLGLMLFTGCGAFRTRGLVRRAGFEGDADVGQKVWVTA